jgi:hypothetical protein
VLDEVESMMKTKRVARGGEMMKKDQWELERLEPSRHD